MILRRVIDHFRKQEWTAIALDFLIVVAGVFLANQVTTWKDEAALSKRKAAAVERLHDESEAIVDYAAERVAFFEKNDATVADALGRLASGDIASADPAAMGAALDTLGLAPAAAPPRSAYDELIGAGLFADIGDAQLRAAIADYYAYLSFAQAQIDYVRQAITAESAQRRFAGMRRVYDRDAFRRSSLVVDLPALAADPDFLDYAVGLNAIQMAQLQWWSILLVRAKTACAEIARFDGRPCAPKTPGDGEAGEP